MTFYKNKYKEEPHELFDLPNPGHRNRNHDPLANKNSAASGLLLRHQTDQPKRIFPETDFFVSAVEKTTRKIFRRCFCPTLIF